MNEDVLKQPIPAQESLAKEEVSKLNDIHRQLQDQEATLKLNMLMQINLLS